MDTSTDSIQKYDPDEKILCFHGPLLYEAKCLAVKTTDDDGFLYRVHYKGWNKNWDEWVTDRRMFKYNAEGLKKQKELEIQIKSGKKMKMLRKSDLQKQSLPPVEVLAEVERMLKPGEVKEEPGDHSSPDKSSSTGGPSLTVIDTSPASSISTSNNNQPAPNDPTSQADVDLTTTSGGGGEVKNEEESSDAGVAAAAGAQRRAGRPAKATNRRPGITTTASSDQGSGVTNQQPIVDGDESSNSTFRPAELKMVIPENLRCWLVDDWDLVTRQARLYKLPAPHTITSILDDFLAARGDQPIMVNGQQRIPLPNQPGTLSLTSTELRREFASGLEVFFNTSLGGQLLYKFERLQYAELLKQQKGALHHQHQQGFEEETTTSSSSDSGNSNSKRQLSDFYGPIHFLRMFVNFRETVPNLDEAENDLSVVEALIAEVLEFLDQNHEKYYRIEDYIVATAEYQRRVMC